MRRKYYGWKRDSLDPRDLHFAQFAPTLPPVLPSHVDLGGDCSTLENQGELGSCTANALAGAFEYVEIKKKMPFFDASRLFIYYNERMLEGTTRSDSGAEIRDGIKTMARHGVCSEKLWPYNIKNFKKKPPVKCYQDAAKHKILTYYKIIGGLDRMRQCLALGFPFVFGFTVFESFETIGPDGMMPMPNINDEENLGGHAVMADGYDDGTECFKVRNSWGCEWAKGGEFFMPYKFIANKRLASDFWMITDEE